MLEAELSDDFGGVAVLAVDGLVHAAHVGGGDAASQGVEGELDFWRAAQRFLADEGDGLVRREVMAVVLQNRKIKLLNGTVGGVAGDHVDLIGPDGAVEQAEVHGAGRAGEAETVGCGKAGQAVGALLELVAHAETPLGGVGGGLAEGGEVQAASICAASTPALAPEDGGVAHARAAVAPMGSLDISRLVDRAGSKP